MSATAAAKRLKACLDAKYIVVMRAKHDDPIVGADDTFIAGSSDVDVLVFRLKDAKSLGGFSVKAKNSDKVHGTEAVKAAKADLQNRIKEAVGAELDARLKW